MDYILTEGRLYFGLNGRNRYHSDRGARRWCNSSADSRHHNRESLSERLSVQEINEEIQYVVHYFEYFEYIF